MLNKVTGWNEEAVSLGFNEIILFNFRSLAKYINKKFVHIVEYKKYFDINIIRNKKIHNYFLK